MQVFRNNRPFTYIIILLYGGLLHLIPAFSNTPFSFVEGYSFATILLPFLGYFSQHSLAAYSLAYLIVFAQAIYLNYILTSNRIYPRDTLIPAFIFITFSALLAGWCSLNTVLIAQTFFLFSLNNLFLLAQVQNELPRENIFFTSLALGVGSLLYLPVLLFYPVMLVALLFRAFAFRDILLNITGFIIPYYFLGLYFFWKDKSAEYFSSLVKIFTPEKIILNADIYEIGLIGLMVFLTVPGYFVLIKKEEFRTLKTRRLINIFTGCLFIILAGTPFISSDKTAYCQLFIIPVSVFAGKAYDREKLPWYQSILFVVFLLFIFFLQLEKTWVIHLLPY